MQHDVNEEQGIYDVNNVNKYLSKMKLLESYYFTMLIVYSRI